MQSVSKVFAEYGMAKLDMTSKKEVKSCLRRVFEKFELTYETKGIELEEILFLEFVNSGSGTAVVDIDQFKKKLNDHQLDLTIPDWQLKGIGLGIYNFFVRNQIMFQAQKSFVEEAVLAAKQPMKN